MNAVLLSFFRLSVAITLFTILPNFPSLGNHTYSQKEGISNTIDSENQPLPTSLDSDMGLRNKLISVLGLCLSVFALLIFLLIRQGYKLKNANFELEYRNKLLQNQRKTLQKNQKAVSTANRRLKTLNEELATQISEKSEIVRIVAHDLRSPLNNILGLCELLSMEGGLTESQKKYLRLINKVIQDGDGLIQRILDADAIEQEKVKLAPEMVEVGDLSADIIEQAKIHAERKSIKVTATYPTEPSRVFTDKELLKQAMSNLMSNAIKFSPRETAIHIRVSSKSDSVTWAVQDQGPGIPNHEQGLLFKRFSKLSPQPTGDEKSTGLGLSIVKSIAEKLNGEVGFRSKVGEGSVFFVTLPKRIGTHNTNEEQKNLLPSLSVTAS